MTEKIDDFMVHQSEKPQFMPQLESQFSQLNNRVATTGTASGAGTACSAAARLVVEGQAKCSSWWGDKAGPKHNISTENGRDTLWRARQSAAPGGVTRLDLSTILAQKMAEIHTVVQCCTCIEI